MADSDNAPVNPDDLGRGPMVMGVTWTFSILSIIVVAVRFWVRITVANILSVEDWLMLFAGMLNLACNSIVSVAYRWGMGKHDRDLTFDQLINVLKWTWIQTVPGILSSVIARVSIAILLVRIFGTKTWLKWFLIVVTILQAVSNIAIIIAMWTQASPVEAVWNPVIPARRSDPRLLEYFGYVGGSFFALGDLTYVLLPVVIVWRLNMQFRRKVGLCVLLALSLFTFAISIVKTTLAQGDQQQGDDAVYNATMGIVFGLMEQSFVIMMGCAPPLRSMTKLKLASTLSFTTSLKRLIGRPDTGEEGDSHRLSRHSHGPYYELGMAGQTQSQVHAGAKGSSLDNTDSHSVDAGKIRRTDQYLVSSDERNDTWRPGMPVANAI
ncbi:hypothetical protein GGR52DRAFT_543196 [Hypoxylon sp. FL1284]|nr:hypothetical protein GGR52DRAFT_543196 [Hypoxylon sp. FL1284]